MLPVKYRTNDWSTDRLTDWWTSWLTDRPTDGRPDRLTEQLSQLTFEKTYIYIQSLQNFARLACTSTTSIIILDFLYNPNNWLKIDSWLIEWQTSSPMYLVSCVLSWPYFSFMSSWYILWSSLINWSFMSKAFPQHVMNSLKCRSICF